MRAVLSADVVMRPPVHRVHMSPCAGHVLRSGKTSVDIIITLWVLFVAWAATVALGYNNGVGEVPQMGWNSWNTIGGNISEEVAMAIADGLVSSGLREAGYVYVCLDDGVMLANRSANGSLIADPAKFTNGSLKTLGDYLHARSLKLGVYSSGGTTTCMKRAGSYGHETQDASTWASWGVDYAKLDWCGSQEPARTWYPRMQKALNDTGRHIFFAMCEWGDEDVWEWGAGVANSWRTWDDICNYWETNHTENPYCAGVSEVIQQNEQYWSFAGPYGWNDPCFLVTGNQYVTATVNLTMTPDQFASQMSLWAMMAAPLIISADLRTGKISRLQEVVLGNKGVIAVDQDTLGKAGRIVCGQRPGPPTPPPPSPPVPPPAGPCAFPHLRDNCSRPSDPSGCAWQYCCPGDWSNGAYGAIAGRSCGTGVDPSEPDTNLQRCCWNRVTEPCNASSECDPGGEGCVTTGTVSKKYGTVTCRTNVAPPSRTATCVAAEGTVSHPTPTAWLCTAPQAQPKQSRFPQPHLASLSTLTLPTPLGGTTSSSVQVWARNLTGDALAIAVYNNGNVKDAAYEFSWDMIPGAGSRMTCVDLWAETEFSASAGGSNNTALAGKLRPWQCLMFRCVQAQS